MSEPSTSEAIEALYDAYRHDVYRYALFVLGNPKDAEDATQEVFLKAFRSWTSFHSKSNPKTWLWSILRNHITDVLRRRKRQRESVDNAVDLSTIPSKTLGSIVEWEDILKLLSLPQRQVVYCRLIENLSVKDSAEVLDWNSAKVRITLHRALKRLRQHLSSDAFSMGKERETHDS